MRHHDHLLITASLLQILDFGCCGGHGFFYVNVMSAVDQRPALFIMMLQRCCQHHWIHGIDVIDAAALSHINHSTWDTLALQRFLDPPAPISSPHQPHHRKNSRIDMITCWICDGCIWGQHGRLKISCTVRSATGQGLYQFWNAGWVCVVVA